MKKLQLLSSASLIGLIFLCLAWESRLAPLRPGGSFLMFKALPLLFPLFGILHGRLYTYRWASMLVLAYLAEGLVRVWSDKGVGAVLASAEIALALTFFLSSIFFVRTAVRGSQPTEPETPRTSSR